MERYSCNDDDILICKAQNGEMDAFGCLVERYNKAIYRYLYRLVGNHSDADDLSQDVFMYALESINSFKVGTNFTAWLYTIARNRYFNFHKKKSRETVLPKNAVETLACENSDPANPVSPGVDEVHKAVTRAVEGLPIEQRQVVVLHIMEGLPHKEIAEIMDCNEKTIRWRLFWARKKLKKTLNDYLTILEQED